MKKPELFTVTINASMVLHLAQNRMKLKVVFRLWRNSKLCEKATIARKNKFQNLFLTFLYIRTCAIIISHFISPTKCNYHQDKVKAISVLFMACIKNLSHLGKGGDLESLDWGKSEDERSKVFSISDSKPKTENIGRTLKKEIE